MSHVFLSCGRVFIRPSMHFLMLYSIDDFKLRTKGWLRLVGSLKLLVNFAEYSLFSWALLMLYSVDDFKLRTVGWLRLIGSLKL